VVLSVLSVVQEGVDVRPETVRELIAQLRASADALEYLHKALLDAESGISGGVSIEEIGLPVRVRRALLAAGIRTVRQLTSMTPRELQAIPNIAETSVDEIHHLLGRIGLGVKEYKV
jgi:DNA-directed RNA polymerase alpha subunit